MPLIYFLHRGPRDVVGIHFMKDSHIKQYRAQVSRIHLREIC
jgi:hypothetical protein